MSQFDELSKTYFQFNRHGSLDKEAAFSRSLEHLRITNNLASRSEIAITVLLERYTNWKAVPGITTQVEVQPNMKVDFKVNDTILEYHPFLYTRAFVSKSAINDYVTLLHQLDRPQRILLQNMARKELTSQYYKRRRSLLNSSYEFASCNLIVCTTPDEFFTFLRKIATEDIPSHKKLCRMFRKIKFDEKWNKQLELA